MEIIKTSTHVLCLSTPFKSCRILQDSKSEQVDQTLPLMYSALLEDGRWKQCWRWLHKWQQNSLITLVSLHCWGRHSGSGLVWLGPDYASCFLLPPTFPICCHWRTHITMPRAWFSWKCCWGGREAGTMRVNRSCLQLDWLKLILKQHP